MARNLAMGERNKSSMSHRIGKARMRGRRHGWCGGVEGNGSNGRGKSLPRSVVGENRKMSDVTFVCSYINLEDFIFYVQVITWNTQISH